jgi:hypothetical protein
VQGSFSAAANQSVSGTVGASIIGAITATIAQGSSISGTLLVEGINAPSASVTGNPVYIGGIDGSGSIQGAKIVTVVSVAGGLAWLGVTSVSGTAGAAESGTWQVSIAGAYAGNSASIGSGLGVLGLGVRNDTFASTLSTTDGYYSPYTVGNVGEQIVANAPITKWVNGTSGAIYTGSSVAVIAAQGTGIYTYITGVQVANPSASPVYVTLAGSNAVASGASILAYTIAPASGGSNIVFSNPLKVVGPNAAFTASISAFSSVYVSAQGFISKT